MSIKNMTWVFERSPYKLGARLVHLALADYANDEKGGLVWANQDSLASKAGVSRATVNTTLAKMVTDGWLEVLDGHEATAAGVLSGRARVYRFLTCQKSNCKEDDAGTVKSTDSRLLSTEEEQKGAEVSEPLRGFEVFWDTYPRRNGFRAEKMKALQYWAKLPLEDKRAAYRGAVVYARECDAGRTIAKDAFRWLRDRSWPGWLEEPVESVERTTNNPEVPWA